MMNQTSKLKSVILPSGQVIPASSPENILSGENTSASSPTSNIRDLNWILKLSVPGKVFKDVSFANLAVGYIVTELGAVYKSTDGGDTWNSVLDLGFPYYWYGVHALTPDTVVISGFNNQAAFTEGVVRWSFDGGSSWSSDINLTVPITGVGWLERIHFFNKDTGIVFNSFSGGCWYTTTGGQDSDSWSYIVINPDYGWFAGNADAQPSGNVYATGIHFAQSSDYGATWNSSPSADSVFDGGVDFLDENNLFGWTGGGQISAPVAGWVRRTTDGADSWSPRLNTFPYPIRALKFFDENSGFVVGGNLYDEAGGIYSTTDGGSTWNLDVSTGAEMFSIDTKPVSIDSTDVWCVGSTGGTTGFTGKLYKVRIGKLATDNNNIGLPVRNQLKQNYPNPFAKSTRIDFIIAAPGNVSLKVYDVLGNEMATLVNHFENPGAHSVDFDASLFQNGIYYYRLQVNGFIERRKLIVSR